MINWEVSKDVPSTVRQVVLHRKKRDGLPTKNRKHILGMFLVPSIPCLIGKRFNFSGAVVPLVERNDDQSLTIMAIWLLLQALVPMADGRGRHWLHACLRLQSRVEQPQARNVLRLRKKFIISINCAENSSNHMCLFGQRRGGL